MTTDINEQRKALRDAALHFHEFPKPGKLEIQPLKPLGNQRDLALAYSPGVAAPCEEIAQTPEAVARYTSRQNLVAASPSVRLSLWSVSISSLWRSTVRFKDATSCAKLAITSIGSAGFGSSSADSPKV